MMRLLNGLVLMLVMMAGGENTETGKKIVATIDDLPRHTYAISDSLTGLLQSDRAFLAFATLVRNDIENDLKTCDIRDSTTLKDLYRILEKIAVLNGQYDEALAKLEAIRMLETKPAGKYVTGLIDISMIRARREAGNRADSVFRQSLVRNLTLKVDSLPWDVVQDRLKETKGNLEFLSENYFLGLVQSQLEPGLKLNRTVSNAIATQLINIYYYIKIQLPVKEQIIAVLDDHIKANQVEKPDIWSSRRVDLTAEKNLHPVISGIWDSGIDTTVFPGRLYINKKERCDGKDNDGNGYIDDIHGIAYDEDDTKTIELLCPIENAQMSMSEAKDLVKGFFDLQTGIASPEASILKQKMAGVRPADVRSFIETLAQFAGYAHGTHTTGIAVDGNPAALILPARLTVDYHAMPSIPTKESAIRCAKMYREVIGYFKAHGARIVNMSWGGTIAGTESALEANGIGADAAERAKLAREFFDIEKKGIYEAIKGAPEILFVNAAGNDNDEVAFEDYYPSSFDLPNVLVVGAVDQAGDITSFTSFGKTVRVYANGYNVESYIPGGSRLSISGTSVAAPAVANLAAKLLAFDPSLTPAELVSLIERGADKSQDGRILLLNPKRTIELLRSMGGK